MIAGLNIVVGSYSNKQESVAAEPRKNWRYERAEKRGWVRSDKEHLNQRHLTGLNKRLTPCGRVGVSCELARGSVTHFLSIWSGPFVRGRVLVFGTRARAHELFQTVPDRIGS